MMTWKVVRLPPGHTDRGLARQHALLTELAAGGWTLTQIDNGVGYFLRFEPDVDRGPLTALQQASDGRGPARSAAATPPAKPAKPLRKKSRRR